MPPALQECIDLVQSATRAPNDGASEITITATVRDQEGRRFPYAPVTWSADFGAIISADSAANAVGVANLVVQAPTTASTATILATSGGVTSERFAQFAPANAPSVWVEQPLTGTTVSGDVDIVVQATDSAGQGSGVSYISVLVDGTELDCNPDSVYDEHWRSYRLPNGTHQITATATDWDGNTSSANVVTVTLQNGISSFSVTPDAVAPNQPVQISAQVADADGWSVTVTNCEDQLIWSTTGAGPTISAQWPGESEGDVCTITATDTTTGDSASLAGGCQHDRDSAVSNRGGAERGGRAQYH